MAAPTPSTHTSHPSTTPTTTGPNYVHRLTSELLATDVAPYLDVFELLGCERVSHHFFRAVAVTPLAELLARHEQAQMSKATKRRRKASAKQVSEVSVQTALVESSASSASPAATTTPATAMFGQHAWRHSLFKPSNIHYRRLASTINWSSLAALSHLDLTDAGIHMPHNQFIGLMSSIIPQHFMQLRSLKARHKLWNGQDTAAQPLTLDTSFVHAFDNLSVFHLETNSPNFCTQYVDAILTNSTRLTDLQLSQWPLPAAELLPQQLIRLHLSSRGAERPNTPKRGISAEFVATMAGRLSSLQYLQLDASPEAFWVQAERLELEPALRDLIAASPQLQDIRLTGMPVPSSVMQQLAQMQALHTLQLLSCGYQGSMNEDLLLLLQRLHTFVLKRPHVESARDSDEEDDAETPGVPWASRGPGPDSLRQTFQAARLTSLTVPLHYHPPSWQWIDGMPVLQNLVSLQLLALSCRPLEADTSVRLCRIVPNLRTLSLPECDIDDDGLAALATGLPSVTSLSLGATSRLTDDGLRALASMTQLKHLAISLKRDWRCKPQFTLLDVCQAVGRNSSITSLHVKCGCVVSELKGTSLQQLVPHIAKLHVEAISRDKANLQLMKQAAELPSLQQFECRINGDGKEVERMVRTFKDAHYALRSTPAAQVDISFH